MKVVSQNTHTITQKDKSVNRLLDQYIPSVKEQSVVVVTSKIVSICEGSIIPIGSVDKDKLIRENADFYTDRGDSQYNVMLTVKNGILAAGAGIDESNGFGHYILWPKDAQKSANSIREFLVKRFKVKHVGVVISDSRTSPLRWGTTGMAIAHSGFQALKDYIGSKDIFGREFQFAKLNVADSLAAAAVLTMGEGKERAPIAVIEDLRYIKFQTRNPTKKELEDLRIEIKDDLYAPILTKAGWKKGGRSRKDML